VCFGTNPRLQFVCHLNSIKVANTSVPLANHIKLISVTFDSHLNFDEHISNVCSSSFFHFRAFCLVRLSLDSETFKTIACVIICSRLFLPSFFSRNIYRLQLIQISLARVVTCSTTNTTSALFSINLIGFHFSNTDFNWLLLPTFHSTTSALNACHLYYTPTRHRVSFGLPPSISTSNIVSTLLLPPWFSACWSFSLEFPPSSFKIYRLLHWLRI